MRLKHRARNWRLSPSWEQTPAEELDPEAVAAARRLLGGFRRRYGLTIREAAARLGVWHPPLLAEWENGRQPMPLWAQGRLRRLIVALRESEASRVAAGAAVR